MLQFDEPRLRCPPSQDCKGSRVVYRIYDDPDRPSIYHCQYCGFESVERTDFIEERPKPKRKVTVGRRSSGRRKGGRRR